MKPAVVVLRDGHAYTAIQVSASDAGISGIFIHADPARLRRVGVAASA